MINFFSKFISQKIDIMICSLKLLSRLTPRWNFAGISYLWTFVFWWENSESRLGLQIDYQVNDFLKWFSQFSLSTTVKNLLVRGHSKSMSTTDFLTPLVTVCLAPLPPCHHPNSDELWADNDPPFDAKFISHVW